MVQTPWQAFSDRIAWEGNVHLACETTATLPDPAALARLEELNAGVLATLDYDIRPGWRLSAAAADQRSEYESFTRKDRDRSASLALEREFSRHLIGRLEAQRRERNSSDLGQSYSENAFIITFQYRR